jgi:starvation-inducible DNA-binding protein
MNTLNNIGLDSKKAKGLADQLNTLLANYTVFYMNVRGFHWNLKGDKFFTLHVKFEELYNDLEAKIDEIAERILTLGHTPVHTLSDYLRIAELKECHDVTTANETVSRVLEGFRTVLTLQRSIADLSSEAGDGGTNDMVTGYTREQEKMVWMYNAFLSNSTATNIQRPGQEQETGSGM